MNTIKLSQQLHHSEFNIGSELSSRFKKLINQGIKASFIAFFINSFTVSGQEVECASKADSEESVTIDKLTLISHPVFDESQPDSLYLHSLANWLHINTQQHVVEKLLPFAQADVISRAQFAETERILNQYSFLRKSRVSLIEDCESQQENELKVETWDTWSLVPYISFGRRAGNNKYAFGFKEDNFLGLGVHAGVQYKKDHLRSGYQVAFSMPLSFPKQSTVELEFADNDDGQKTYLAYSKPFYQQSSKQQHLASILKENRRDSIYQNGELAWQFSHEVEQSTLAFGHLITQHQLGAVRMHLGINKELHRFTSLDSAILAELPSDRRFTFPWIGLEYSQADYQIFSNIRFIDHREDINLGWQLISKIGVDISSLNTDESQGVHLENILSKGMQWQNTLMLFSTNYKAYWQREQPDHQQVAAEFELYQYLTPRWAGYFKAQWQAEKNQYLYIPLALGGDTGVRGYAEQYQHGEHLWSASAELRYNPHWELYQLVNVAWAAFVDSGKAWGQTPAINSNDTTLQSIGIGARLFSSHSSEGNVVHMDIIKPLTMGPNVDSWQWRVQVKQSL